MSIQCSQEVCALKTSSCERTHFLCISLSPPLSRAYLLLLLLLLFCAGSFLKSKKYKDLDLSWIFFSYSHQYERWVAPQTRRKSNNNLALKNRTVSFHEDTCSLDDTWVCTESESALACACDLVGTSGRGVRWLQTCSLSVSARKGCSGQHRP